VSDRQKYHEITLVIEANCSYEVGYSLLSASTNLDETAASQLNNSSSPILMNKRGDGA
jgi:hypothetical protein